MSNYVNLLDIVYPVGSIYQSFSDVSPTSSVGGTWEKIENKFLLPSTKSNTIGGQEKHTHTYSLELLMNWRQPMCFDDNDSEFCHISKYDVDNHLIYETMGPEIRKNESFTNGYFTRSSTNQGSGAVYHPTGNTTYENNYPPYITIYCWRRTA